MRSRGWLPMCCQYAKTELGLQMMITRNALFAAGLIAASTPALASMIDTTVAWNGGDNTCSHSVHPIRPLTAVVKDNRLAA